MAIYSISYDLNKVGQNYEILINEIKLSNSWCKPMESHWLISSRETVTQVYNRLAKHLDKNDSILVTKLSPDYYGFLPQVIWNWLKEHSYELA